MGNFACCQRPQEIIEDKELLKKNSVKKEGPIEGEISRITEKDISFFSNINKQKQEHLSLSENNQDNNDKNNPQNINSDLENKSDNIQTKSSLGPKDNFRKRKSKNDVTKESPPTKNNEQYCKKFPVDRIREKKDNTKEPLNNSRRQIESDNNNNKNQNEKNQNPKEQIYNKVIAKKTPIDKNAKLNIIEKHIQKSLTDHQINIDNNNQKMNNKNLAVSYLQGTEEGDPKDSNEIYQAPILNYNFIINGGSGVGRKIEQNEEKNQTKEPTKNQNNAESNQNNEISELEVEELYKKCREKGETEPDDDFSPDTYKNFYPENDPFFNFDKGAVTQAQIILNPDDFNNLEIYEGEINDKNQRHGYGVCTTPYYVRRGMWRNGEFTGWGRESRRNRDILEGKFVNGTVNGKGFLRNSRGNLYIGDFVNSLREGKGELNTKRIHYIGEFKGDKLNGIGVIEFIKEGHRYEGEFKNNEINGKGVFKWQNGDIYEGDMINGKMHGHGVYKYCDGQIYDGDYLDGLREGKGRIIVSEKVIYEGDFKNGHRFDQGVILSQREYEEDNKNQKQ